MYRKDYILRMIEMLGQLIAGILELIKKGDVAKASQLLENAYHDMLHHDASFFQDIPFEELTHKLLEEHHFTNDHLEILSELFFAQGELTNAQGKQTDSLMFYQKSLLLLDFVMKASKTYSMEKTDKLIRLNNKIEDLKTE